MIIRFLIFDAYAVGGTIRTTFLLAGALADRHEVEIVSVLRSGREPKLELDPRVRLRALSERGGWGPSRLIHRDEVRYPRFSLRSDVALWRFLRSVKDGVLIATRPGLNLALARHGRRSVVRIGQDHMNLDAYRPGLLDAIRAHYGRLDAVSALTEGTAQGYRDLVGPDATVVCIPNAAPARVSASSRLDAPLVIAAGALSTRKGFDRLLEAWARVAPERPDWRLEIFGEGPAGDDLHELVETLGVSDSVQLRGHSSQVRQEMARASAFVMTSRREGFPMVLLEAMSVGLPTVAYDCPTGPRDIISHGVDGYVVPNGRTRLLAGALERLMDDADLRSRMGAAALENVARYRIDVIAARWEALFEELGAA